MGEINSLSETLERKFGAQIRVASYNTFYDDTDEIQEIIDKITWSTIILPAVFICGELAIEGLIDEPAISQILKDRGLEEVLTEKI